MTAPARAVVEAVVDRADCLIARVRETGSVRMSHLEMLRVELGMVATEHGKAMAELERLGRENAAYIAKFYGYDDENEEHVCSPNAIIACSICGGPDPQTAVEEFVADLAARDERKVGR